MADPKGQVASQGHEKPPKKKDSACSATLTSILGVTVALLLAALAPVDIFLVSFMKNANGTFKTWAADNSTRHDVESAVSYAYVGLFVAVLLFLFLILPFVYFFYEEKDDDDVSVCT